MKVIYDLIHFSKVGWFGGISKVWLEYFKLLPGSPIEPTFIVGPAHSPVQDYLEEQQYFGGTVVRESPSGIMRKARKLALYRNFQLLKLNFGGAPAIFHSTDYINPLFKQRNLKVITTIFDMVFWDQKHVMKKNIGYWDKVWSTYHSLRVSDYIITCSQASKQAIRRYFPWVADKIVIIPLAIDRSFHTVPIVREKQKNFLFVGGRNAYKNYDRLLQAFARFIVRFPDWNLEVVGGTTSQIRAQEAARYHDLGINEHVIDHGYTEQDKLITLLQHAGALVIPSLNEGFNIPLLEGMAAGTPVLSSDIPASKELGKGYARFFPPTSVEAIVEAMRDLVLHPPSYDQLIEAQKYARVFRWEDSFRRLLEVYSSCITP